MNIEWCPCEKRLSIHLPLGVRKSDSWGWNTVGDSRIIDGIGRQIANIHWLFYLFMYYYRTTMKFLGSQISLLFHSCPHPYHKVVNLFASECCEGQTWRKTLGKLKNDGCIICLDVLDADSISAISNRDFHETEKIY